MDYIIEDNIEEDYSIITVETNCKIINSCLDSDKDFKRKIIIKKKII